MQQIEECFSKVYCTGKKTNVKSITNKAACTPFIGSNAKVMCSTIDASEWISIIPVTSML